MASRKDWSFDLIDLDADAGCNARISRDETTDGEANVKIGTDVKVDTIKFEKTYDDGSEHVYKGPSAGVDLGLKLTEKEQEFSSMAELSVASAKIESSDGIVVAPNLNANTGIKVGSNGVKFGILGFGLTGHKGIFSIDTPLGSIGCNTANKDKKYEKYGKSGQN